MTLAQRIAKAEARLAAAKRGASHHNLRASPAFEVRYKALIKQVADMKAQQQAGGE